MTRQVLPEARAELGFPTGSTVAPHEFGDDDQAAHRLIQAHAAWASVPGHAERDLDQWHDMVRRCRSFAVAIGLSTYGHVIEELDEAPRISAEQAITAARSEQKFGRAD